MDFKPKERTLMRLLAFKARLRRSHNLIALRAPGTCPETLPPKADSLLETEIEWESAFGSVS
jgi:hypothetical protein